MSFEYVAYGLQITSNIALPLMSLAEYRHGGGPARGGLPGIFITLHEDYSTHIDPDDGQGAHWTITRERAKLVIKSLGTFEIDAGRGIDIHPVPPIDEKMIQLLLINSVLAILLFQRNMLVLHCSCIELGGAGVAFTGNSGAGKSLMAGALCSLGHGLITDDIAAVDMSGQALRVPAGYPMIKMLAKDSRMLGFDERRNILLHERHDKLGCRLEKDSFSADRAVPLRHIFVLSTGERRCIQRLSARESFIHLLGNTAPQIWRVTPDDLHFTHLEKLCQNVTVHRFTREKNVDALPEHAEMIKKYCNDSHTAATAGRETNA